MVKPIPLYSSEKNFPPEAEGLRREKERRADSKRIRV